MHIGSVQVSRVKEVAWRDRMIKTGIFKESVAGPVLIAKLNLAGDAQADLKNHGGIYQAVYTYAAEHYSFWEARKAKTLPPGTFGENLTTVGLDEAAVRVGDIYKFGSAVLKAVQPRYPCSKLGIVFGDQGIIPEFVEAGRTGIYWQVLQEGAAAAGDLIEQQRALADGVLISEVFAILAGAEQRPEMLRRAAAVVAPNFRAMIERKLAAAP